MDLSASIERLYMPMLAFWWLGMMTGMHFWAGITVAPARPKRQLYLVAEHGRLVEQG
jgi:hypothetical protein